MIVVSVVYFGRVLLYKRITQQLLPKFLLGMVGWLQFQLQILKYTVVDTKGSHSSHILTQLDSIKLIHNKYSKKLKYACLWTSKGGATSHIVVQLVDCYGWLALCMIVEVPFSVA